MSKVWRYIYIYYFILFLYNLYNFLLLFNFSPLSSYIIELYAHFVLLSDSAALYDNNNNNYPIKTINTIGKIINK